jgi:hypothetical protein
VMVPDPLYGKMGHTKTHIPVPASQITSAETVVYGKLDS